MANQRTDSKGGTVKVTLLKSPIGFNRNQATVVRNESFSLPGTESQTALDSLSRTFPQAGGSTAQVVVVAPEGASVRDPEIRAAIEQAAEGYQRIGQIEQALSPFDEFARCSRSAPACWP